MYCFRTKPLPLSFRPRGTDLMIVNELTKDASLEFLSRKRLGRLACARNGQPYITPLYFARSGAHIYSFSTIGQKIEWMRLNPLVCVEADEMESAQKWTSVVVLGHYEELPKLPEYEQARELAHSLLEQRSIWWEPAYARTIVKGVERELDPIYFRIRIQTISGRHATL